MSGHLAIVTSDGRNVVVSVPAHDNWALCLTCGALIESRRRHEFRGCACRDGATWIAVDGGTEYRKFCAGPQAHWRDVDGEHRA